MPRKPRIEVTERDSQTSLDVLMSDPRYAARLQNPFNEPSAPIELKDPSRECRWFNAALATDHIWRNKRKGWDQVRPGDVKDLEQIGGYNKSPDGFITRGERGHEVLMSMPKVVRAAIQIEKTKQNLRNVGNPNATKAEVVNAASAKLGDEAASYLDQHIGAVGAVTDTYERVERVEPE
jgi:hypothetical protein